MKKIKPPRLVTVSVFTTVTIIFWIFFGVYNILTSDADVEIDQELLKPINTNLNIQTLDQLQNKRFYDSSQQFNIFDDLSSPSDSNVNVEEDEDINNGTEPLDTEELETEEITDEEQVETLNEVDNPAEQESL